VTYMTPFPFPNGLRLWVLSSLFLRDNKHPKRMSERVDRHPTGSLRNQQFQRTFLTPPLGHHLRLAPVFVFAPPAALPRAERVVDVVGGPEIPMRAGVFHSLLPTVVVSILSPPAYGDTAVQYPRTNTFFFIFCPLRFPFFRSKP